MKILKYSTIILIAILFAGCSAKMRVEMKILNRNFLLTSQNYWSEKVNPLENKIRYNLVSGEYEKLREKTKIESEKSIVEIVEKLDQARKDNINQQMKNSKPFARGISSLSDSIATIDVLIKQNKARKEQAMLSQQKQTLLTKLDSLRGAQSEYVKDSITTLTKIVIIPEQTIDRLKTAIYELIDREIDSVKQTHIMALAESNKAKLWVPCDSTADKKKNPCAEKTLILDKLRGSYTLATDGFIRLNGLGPIIAREMKELSDFVSNDSNVRNNLKGYTDPNVSGVIEELKEDVNKITQPLTNSNALKSIQNDPLASIVAGAENIHWKAITNKAFARASIGNSDIAFVTQPNGEYTIKGVRNDASNATRATFQFVNFTIEALAKYSGIAMPSNTEGEGDTVATTSGVLIQANSDLKILKINSQSAKIRIFQSILNQEANLSDSLKRQTAVSNIKTVFDASKKTLLNE